MAKLSALMDLVWLYWKLKLHDICQDLASCEFYSTIQLEAFTFFLHVSRLIYCCTNIDFSNGFPRPQRFQRQSVNVCAQVNLFHRPGYWHNKSVKFKVLWYSSVSRAILAFVCTSFPLSSAFRFGSGALFFFFPQFFKCTHNI